MPSDRTRRTTTSRDAAEAAFQGGDHEARGTPSEAAVPNAKELVSLRLTGTFLTTFKKPGRAGKIGSMRRCETNCRSCATPKVTINFLLLGVAS
jgi:hypothetical protein